jgi:large subunit ribosomal protein L14
MKGMVFKVADNSGALYARCFDVKKVKYAKPGVMLKVSILKAIPRSKIAKGTVQDAIVLTTRLVYRRASGESLIFSENTLALVKPDGNPIGSRISQVVPSHLPRSVKSISRGVC